MKDVIKHITETLAVIMINIFAWLAPIEAALKILVLLSTLIYTVLQIYFVYVSILKRRSDIKKEKLKQ